MCGIIACASNRNVVPTLIEGLKRLEYRGYDSAGIAVLSKTNVRVLKCKGRIAELEKIVIEQEPKSFLGIGHTRWATHGKPSKINSHPHSSDNGKIAVVHNGIIENYEDIKEFLVNKGYVFVSETDTEVIAHLIQYYYSSSFIEALLKAMHDIEGSYALGVISADVPGGIFCVRKGSPLVIGIGDKENYIASDIPAILNLTRDMYILEDKEVAFITKDDIAIFDNHGVKLNKEIFHADWDADAAEKGGYNHFMLKEIHEEKEVSIKAISPRIKNNRIMLEESLPHSEFGDIERIFIIGCGTAYHAGMVGKYVIEKIARIPVEVVLASEFRYSDSIVPKNSLALIISQSGETIDSLYAMREAKEKGAKILSIVNVVGSSIARESDNVMYTWAGPEIAVASTKAYTTQLCVLYLFALKMALIKENISKEEEFKYCKEILSIPNKIEETINQKDAIQKLACNFYNANSIFFIGRGLDYALSMEGSLKLKEISYIHSEAYAGGELKHGTIALIEEGTLVICSATQDKLIDKMKGNIREVKARGAYTAVITLEKYRDKFKLEADVLMCLSDTDSIFAPILAASAMQLFAYYCAVEKGCDVDKPRNLAKSVTVE